MSSSRPGVVRIVRVVPPVVEAGVEVTAAAAAVVVVVVVVAAAIAAAAVVVVVVVVAAAIAAAVAVREAGAATPLNIHVSSCQLRCVSDTRLFRAPPL